MSCGDGSAASCLGRQLDGWPVSPQTLIIAGIGLAVVGAVMVWAGRPRPARRRDRTSPPRGVSSALACAAVSAGVITGLEWVVLSHTDRTLVWVVVLGAPAFLAGATVARLLAVGRTVYGRRPARGVLRGSGEHAHD